MGDKRKLQTEIDRTLKKVQEGVEVFDAIWEKVYDPDAAQQRDKNEDLLKKEIKKLQRYRDQIKTWAASSEIKDKKALLDARKIIEQKMERFKVCEKETKTKAFSKEGLGQQPKADPKERARAEARDWLNHVVDEITTQLDGFEAEIESLTSGKKTKQKPPRLVHLEESVTRHKEHILKLEQVLRLVDNEAISPDELNDVKDLIEDYIARNQDAMEEFTNVAEIYEQLNLDALIEKSGALVRDGRRGGSDDESSTDGDDGGSEATASSGVGGRAGDESKPSPPPGKSPASAAKGAAPPPAPAAQPAKAAAKAAGAAGGAAEPRAALPQPLPAQGAAPVLGARTASGSRQPDAAQPQPAAGAPGAPGAPGFASALRPNQPPGWVGAGAGAAQDGASLLAQMGQADARARALPRPDQQALPAEQKSQFLSRLQRMQQGGPGLPMGSPGLGAPSPKAGGFVDAATAAALMGSGPPGGSGSGAGGPGLPANPSGQRQLSGVSGIGGSVSGTALSADDDAKNADTFDAAAPFSEQELFAAAGGADASGEGFAGGAGGGDGARAMGEGGAPGTPGPQGGALVDGPGQVDPSGNLRLLEASFSRCLPQPSDSTPLRRNRQRISPAVQFATFPTAPAPICENPALFERLDSDALFFSFYFQQGSKQQFLAARELKRANWRFHKKHNTWFARQEEPKVVTEDFEQGAYLYFDFTCGGVDEFGNVAGWCQRSRPDFTFDYQFLEADELPQ